MKKLLTIISVFVFIPVILFGIYAIAQLSDPSPQAVKTPEDAYQLGQKYGRGDYLFNDIDKAISYMEIASKVGHTEAMSLLSFYYLGYRPEKSCEEIYKLAEASINDGEKPDALFVIGSLLMDEKCSLYSPAKAKNYLLEAVSHGNKRAFSSLWLYYYEIEPNKEQEKYWGNQRDQYHETLIETYHNKIIIRYIAEIFTWYQEKLSNSQ